MPFHYPQLSSDEREVPYREWKPQTTHKGTHVPLYACTLTQGSTEAQTDRQDNEPLEAPKYLEDNWIFLVVKKSKMMGS